MSIFNTGNPIKKHIKVVPIFMTINNAYAPYAAASIHSLTQHVDPKRYYRVIILHDGLNLVTRIRLRSLVTKNVAIQFKKMSRSIYLKAIVTYCMRRKKGAGDYFSNAVYYYRAFIPHLFPIYKKAVYIDSDTILRGDIGELFDIDLGENALAAMIDPKVTVVPEFRHYVDKALMVPHNEYVNSGVQVMDLRKMRKERYIQKMIELIRKFDADLVAPDQDYLNVIFRGKILPLPECWNSEPQKDLPRSVKLVHFNLFNKPWHYSDVPCEKIFWAAAKGTGFYGDLKRQKENFNKEKQEEDHAKVAALIKKAKELSKVKEPVISMKD